MTANTKNATKANQEAAIEFAIKLFKFMDENKDVFIDGISNKEIAKTLNTLNFKTRRGKQWHTTSVTRVMKYKKHYSTQSSNAKSLKQFF